MPEIGTSGSTSGDGKRRVAAWPKRPRPSSTLPKRQLTARCVNLVAIGAKADKLRCSVPHKVKSSRDFPTLRMASGLQVLFGKLAKLIGNGPRESQHDRSVSDRVPSETIADHVNSAVCRPTRHSSLGAGPALFIFKPKRKFQLQFPVPLKMRNGDGYQ